MGLNESCGLVVYGRGESNYDAYGLTNVEGKYLQHLY